MSQFICCHSAVGDMTPRSEVAGFYKMLRLMVYFDPSSVLNRLLVVLFNELRKWFLNCFLYVLPTYE